MGRIERADATNNMAKMRFNSNLERAKQSDIEKQIEEKELRAAQKRKIDAEELRRHTNLVNATKKNY